MTGWMGELMELELLTATGRFWVIRFEISIDRKRDQALNIQENAVHFDEP